MKFTSVLAWFVVIATEVAVANNYDNRNGSGENHARKLRRSGDNIDGLLITENHPGNNARRRVRGNSSDVSRENDQSNDPIACTWQRYFETMDHTEACLSLQNEYSVPYTCDDGFYTHVCCTVSSCTDPTLNTFGACHKVVTTESGSTISSEVMMTTTTTTEVISTSGQPSDLESNDVAGSVEWLVDDAPPVFSEEEEAPETTDNEEIVSVDSIDDADQEVAIRCTWKSSFEGMSHSDACLTTGDEHIVPYTCEDGRFVCCTVSSCVNPTMNIFGTCLKDNSTEQTAPIGEEVAASDATWINVNDNIDNDGESTSTEPTVLMQDTMTSTEPTETELINDMISTAPTDVNFNTDMTTPADSIEDVDAPHDIQCAWMPWFGTMSHSDACMATGDVYIVPYTCEDNREICCTVSSCVNPTMNTFGTCLKNNADEEAVTVTTSEPTTLGIADEMDSASDATWIDTINDMTSTEPTELDFTDDMTLSEPTTEADLLINDVTSTQPSEINIVFIENDMTSTGSTGADVTNDMISTQPTDINFNDAPTVPSDYIEDADVMNDIQCGWFPWFDTMSHSVACMSTGNEHTVPYVCGDGRKICCTVSDCLNPTMEAFGTCLKVLQGEAA